MFFLAAACVLCVAAPEALAQKKREAPRRAPAAQKPAAPVPATYTVAKGDNLYQIARKNLHPGVTPNQMILALYRANPEAFLGGNINQISPGRVLAIPDLATVAAVDAAQATQQLKALESKPLVPVEPAPPPPAQPAPAVPAAKPRPEPAKPAPRAGELTPAQAEERFQQGLQAERSGDLRAAMAHYGAAGESGNGTAQKRLGDIYNTGNAVVTRDYEIALKWYQKARAQGVEIPKPLIHPPSRPN